MKKILLLTFVTLLAICKHDLAHAYLYSKVETGYILKEGVNVETWTTSSFSKNKKMSIDYDGGPSFGLAIAMDLPVILPLRLELNPFIAIQDVSIRNYNDTATYHGDYETITNKGFLTSLYITPMFKNFLAQPYVFAGLGNGKTSSNTNSAIQSNWLANYGLGISFSISEHMQLDFSYRVINSFASYNSSYQEINGENIKVNLPFNSTELKIGLILHS